MRNIERMLLTLGTVFATVSFSATQASAATQNDPIRDIPNLPATAGTMYTHMSSHQKLVARQALLRMEKMEHATGRLRAGAFIPVPSNYVYNPALGNLHDYCTDAPDNYLAADFRGPCAYHDLCYEQPGNHKTTCDDALFVNLHINCDFAYDQPVLLTCDGVASIYYAAVTAFGDDN